MRFQVEPWSVAIAEMRPLFARLWDDVALDKDRFVAECDEERYAKLEEQGMIHLVTARTDVGVLAGFYACFVMPHLHYLGAGLFAFTDMYFLKKEHRVGNIGMRLFTFLEESLRVRGVVKLYTSHKAHRDRSKMLLALGYKLADNVYSKVLA